MEKLDQLAVAPLEAADLQEVEGGIWPVFAAGVAAGVAFGIGVGYPLR